MDGNNQKTKTTGLIEFLDAQPELFAKNLDEAADFYESLGFQRSFRQGDVHQVMSFGSVTIHLSAIKETFGSCQIIVKNVDLLFERVLATDVEILYDGIGDREWNCRDFTIKDGFGNIVTFSELL